MVIVWGLSFFVFESEKVIGNFVYRKYGCQGCISLWGWHAWPIIGIWVSFLLFWPLSPRAKRNFSNSFLNSKKRNLAMTVLKRLSEEKHLVNCFLWSVFFFFFLSNTSICGLPGMQIRSDSVIPESHDKVMYTQAEWVWWGD